MKQLISFSVLYLLLFSAFGQKKESIDIQYIAIKDSFLVREIEKLIQEEVNRETDTATTDKVYTENLFRKGFGYVDLHIEGNLEGDTLARYYIAPSLTSIKKEAADSMYPPFYTYIGGRLVLVYMPVLANATDLRFSERSKKELRRKVAAFLEKPKDVTVYDLDGNIAFRDKNFQIDYFRFHGGKYLYVLKNGPPIVVQESSL